MQCGTGASCLRFWPLTAPKKSLTRPNLRTVAVCWRDHRGPAPTGGGARDRHDLLDGRRVWRIAQPVVPRRDPLVEPRASGAGEAPCSAGGFRDRVRGVNRSLLGRTLVGVEVVLETETPDGIRVVLPALVYAKVLEEHAAVADLDLIDRTIRCPDERRPDPRPARERFLRREGELLVLAVVEFGEVPAIIVTVFSAITERN